MGYKYSHNSRLDYRWRQSYRYCK